MESLSGEKVIDSEPGNNDGVLAGSQEREITKRRSKNEESSIPPAGEIEKSSDNDFRIIRETRGDVEISKIKDFKIIPNYKAPSIISSATLATANGQDFDLIDGQHYFQAAQLEGRTTLECRILWISDTTDTVLAWVKSYVRTGPIDGESSYAERGRNILILRELLLTDGYLKITPGGTWSHEELKLNIVTKLAAIFKRSKRTVENYLRHFDLLDQKTIEKAVAEDIPKAFFAAIESAKIKFIDSTSGLHDQMTLIQAVSAQVEEWLDNFDRKTGKVSTLLKSNGIKRKQNNVGNAESKEKNGPVADVIESEKNIESMQTFVNHDERVAQVFDNNQSISVEDNDVTDCKGEQDQKPSQASVPLSLYEGGARHPIDVSDQIYLKLQNLADDLNQIAKRRPPFDELAVDIQDLLERLLDLKGDVIEENELSPYQSMLEAAA